jgi:serine protease DegQ
VTETSSETGKQLSDLSDQLADIAERVGASVAAVNARHRVSSSGVLWRQGVIVTADHTIDREDGITVKFAGGNALAATLAGRDPGTDLAVLRIDEQSGVPASISGSVPRVGQLALALGRPGHMGLGASFGVISAVGGAWQTWSGGEVDAFIRPDLTLYPGFSGGPLVHASGQVAGINTSGLSRGGALTIPSSTVERVVEQLLTSGRIARGYVGLGMQPVRLPDGLREALHLQQQTALLVISVAPEGPGEKAGILIGDILTTLRGQPVGDTEAVQRVLGPSSVGQDIAASVIRGGQPVDVTLNVAERPRRGA